jgi:hypothetical protein
MFLVSFSGLFSSELSFEFMNSQVDTPISIFTGFAANEDFAMFTASDYLNADTAALAAVDNHLNLIYAAIILGKFGGLLLSVPLDGVRYFDMFTSDHKEQGESP